MSFPSRMLETSSKAKTGSMEELVPAILEMVPVGAMVSTVAFLLFSPLYMEFSMLGKFPLSSASSLVCSSAFSLMNLAIFSANSKASSVSYLIPIRMKRSASPITPSPILRFNLVISSI